MTRKSMWYVVDQVHQFFILYIHIHTYIERGIERERGLQTLLWAGSRVGLVKITIRGISNRSQ